MDQNLNINVAEMDEAPFRYIIVISNGEQEFPIESCEDEDTTLMALSDGVSLPIPDIITDYVFEAPESFYKGHKYSDFRLIAYDSFKKGDSKYGKFYDERFWCDEVGFDEETEELYKDFFTE